MDDGTLAFEPALEAREVIESFLSQQVLVPDWADRLLAASAGFVQIGERSDDAQLTDLGERLGRLAFSGLGTDSTTREASTDIERLLSALHVRDEPFS